MQNIKKILLKLSLKGKILIFSLPIIIIPILILSGLVSKAYGDLTEKQSQKSIQDSQIIVADRIDRILVDMVDCANYITIGINRIAANHGNELLKDVKTANSIYTELNLAKIIFSEVESVVYVDTKLSLYSDKFLMQNIKADIIESGYLELLEKMTGESIWLNGDINNLLVLKEDTRVVTIGKKVIEITSGETLGYLFVNVNFDEFSRYMDNQITNYYLLDQDQNLVGRQLEDYENDIANKIDKFLNEETELLLYSEEGAKYLFSKYEIESYAWTVIGISDLNEFTLGLEEMLPILIFIIIGMVLIEVIISLYFSSHITSPLMKLKKNTEKIAEGDFSIRCNFKTGDEIGQLGNSFNIMTEKITDLLHKVDYESRKKREYELSLIQEQVKPHFLYNTLDIIIKLSEMKKNREAQRVAKKLADYYRNSLSDSQDNITIQKEINIVTDYLELQQMRYYDLFLYQINIEERLLDMQIPKLILQPLVENSIYHGLKYKKEMGKIYITGKEYEGYSQLCVEDNGIGMSKEILKKINEGEKLEDHFGIYSVNHRLKLYFGDEYGLSVESTMEVGTIVKMNLPKLESGVFVS